MTLEPIGTFHCESAHPYEVGRQPGVSDNVGEIRLRRGLEQALDDLAGFERIWIVYGFHHNTEWKPKVMPPRGPRVKRGVFATRAPYRPNALGLSCVRVLAVEGLRVTVAGHDLLDGTPVFDIKPYLPYADAFPDSRVGWLEEIESSRWAVEISDRATEQLAWLEREGVSQLRDFVRAQLEFDPLDRKRKRVEAVEGGHRLAYRTWRVSFTATDGCVRVRAIESGYTARDLDESADPYADKDLHRRFRARA